jgi:hypothetical protein
MRGYGLTWAAALALALGCASPEKGAAQDHPPQQTGAQAYGAGAAPAAGAAQDAKKPASWPRLVATVKDRYLEQPWQLVDAVLFVPEVSLFGGGGGEEKHELQLKIGAAEVEVPLARITRIDIGAQDEDLLTVTVTLRPEGDAPAEQHTGTVRSSLELHGTYGGTALKTVVKLRELLRVELGPLPAGR